MTNTSGPPSVSNGLIYTMAREEQDGVATEKLATQLQAGGRLRILWLKTELLHPVDKGGKIRTIEMLKRLKRYHHITYLTLDDGTATADAYAQAEEYCHELICVPFEAAHSSSVRFYSELLRNLLSRLPYAIERYRSGAMRRAIAEQSQARRHDLLVSDFLVSAVNIPPRLTLPKVLFQHNVEAMIWRRRVENARHVAAKLYFTLQWRRMAAFECLSCRDFDVVIGVSEQDCSIMRSEYGIESVAAVPTGVDTEYFRPSGILLPVSGKLVFTGSMDWMPNEDAIRFFIKEIMPLVQLEVPEATLTVVGRNPSAALLDIARSRHWLIVTGRVDDVRPFIEEAACFIVPIRIGGGTRLKIYEAMAMEKPVVSTRVGAEGLPIGDGVDILLADDPKAFAAAVVKVLRDENLARAIGARAAANVRGWFGWDRVAVRFSELCESGICLHWDK